MASPLIFASMGGLLSERSGVMNIALEGFMLMGAFSAAAGAHYTGNPYLGLLIGALAAGFTALIHAFWCITLRGDQIVAGTAINLLGIGVPAFLLQRLFGTVGRSPTVERLPSITSGLNILVPVAFLLVPTIWYFLYRTNPGLRVLAAGEQPRAAESVGVAVDRYRYGCVLASGILAGIGGAFLSIGDLSLFTNGMTNGRGFIALAALVFGNWMPLGTLGAALFFGAAQAVQIQSQAVGLPVSKELIIALPYLLTLIALTGVVRNSTPPAGLGKHATAD
ncbi:MAG: ABC transporter permease [Chloroflexota bacterium]|nr:ABC transporter permease [Chloroflexota bacterium]